MRSTRGAGPLLGLAMLAWTAAAGGADEAIRGIGPTGAIHAVRSGFVFTEGPAVDARGDIYFTDVRANRIYKVSTDGEISTFLEDTEGANGLMFGGDGRLFACQGTAKRIVAIDVASKKLTTVAEGFEGRPFERPNDLVVDRNGGVYFTDPSASSVYHAGANGGVARLVDDLPRPNGVLLSPDEATLYVLPSGSPDVMAYPVEAPGKIGRGRVLCRLEQAPNGQARGGDGLTVDETGNLYLTQPGLGTIQVVSPSGETLGLIRFPEAPSNCCFGGPDLQTLYVTARTSIYAAPMRAKGHRFGQSR